MPFMVYDDTPVAVCDTCNKVITLNDPGLAKLKRHIEGLGWEIGEEYTECPKCLDSQAEFTRALCLTQKSEEGK